MHTDPSRLNALVDVVDGKDQVVAARSRTQLLPTGANFRVVHIFLFNDQGDLLLQRIAPGLRHEAMWGSSVAGYVYSGESYDHAAERKLNDELGISAGLQRIGKTSMIDNASTKFISFYQSVYNGPLHPDPAQISELAFEPLPGIIRQHQLGQRTFTPTFLYLLDYYLRTAAVP